jgi:hypothetical protein
MTAVSKSPDKFSFRVKAYLNTCLRDNREPIKEYLDFLEKAKKTDMEKFDNHDVNEPNLEYDLLTTDWILEKARSSKRYSQNLYAALCNNDFVKNEVWPLLQDRYCSYSWRYAGGIIADMRQEGDYIDWYCSSYTKGNENWDGVLEGTVTEEIENDLHKLGWLLV